MSTELHDQIREYAEWLDASAPPLDDLMPPLTQPRPRAVWVRAVVAAAAVVIVGVALYALLGQERTISPIDTITPAPEEGAVVLVDYYAAQISGKDFAPGATVDFSLTAGEMALSLGGSDYEIPAAATVGLDGRFQFGFSPDQWLEPGDTITITTDGSSHSVVVLPMEFQRLDPVADLAVGLANVPDGTPVIVRIESGPNLTIVETETFNGQWQVDLSTDVDVTLEAVGSAWIASADGYAVAAGRHAVADPRSLFLDQGTFWLEGDNFTPDAQVEVEINGSPLAAPVATSAGGHFSLTLPARSWAAGDVITVVDGEVTKQVSVYDVFITELDESTGTISGTTDLPEGWDVVVGTDQDSRTVSHVDGTWSATFSPDDPFLTYNAGYVDEDGDWVGGRNPVDNRGGP